MMGTIEYHDRSAVMKDIHAYIVRGRLSDLLAWRSLCSTYQMKCSHVGIVLSVGGT